MIPSVHKCCWALPRNPEHPETCDPRCKGLPQGFAVRDTMLKLWGIQWWTSHFFWLRWSCVLVLTHAHIREISTTQSMMKHVEDYLRDVICLGLDLTFIATGPQVSFSSLDRWIGLRNTVIIQAFVKPIYYWKGWAISMVSIFSTWSCRQWIFCFCSRSFSSDRFGQSFSLWANPLKMPWQKLYCF